jgi:hypothetical protein
VDLTDDKNNCGFCSQVCGSNLICVDSQCACPPGTTDCAGICADLSTAADNCGACGNACSAGQTCVLGKCQ